MVRKGTGDEERAKAWSARRVTSNFLRRKSKVLWNLLRFLQKAKKVSVGPDGDLTSSRGPDSATPSGVQLDETKLGNHKLEEGEQLLPGIPDEITINVISLRLPSMAFHELSRVSRSWHQAIKGRQLYDARVRFQTTETLLAFNHQPNGVNRIAIYSIQDDHSYHLPSIPDHSLGIPWFCGYAFLDGKLYVLGGSRCSTSDAKLDDGLSGDEVYVFDVPGQKQWKRLASMNKQRGEFGCCVMNGKIYVFGGRNEDGPVHAAEVYDPKEDAWSPITPLPSLGFNQKVTPVGDELFVHSGDFYDSDFVWTGVGDRLEISNDDHIHIAPSAEVYHPHRDEWRIVEHFTPKSQYRGAEVMVAGKLHRMDGPGCHVYDIDARSWKLVQSTKRGEPSSEADSEPGLFEFQRRASALVDNEVFLIWEWIEGGEAWFGLCKSENFGIANTELAWKNTKCFVSFRNSAPPFMHSIQL